MSDSIVGGWTPYRTQITPEEAALLQKAVGVGMSYSPVAVATQPVAGTNYRFFCNAKVVGPEAYNEAKLVQFYVGFDAKGPQDVKITDVPCEDK